MRILYLHQYFNTPAMAGGTRSYEMARRLVRLGHDVQLITSRRDRAPGAAGGWLRTREDGIQVHWLPVPYSHHMPYGERLKAFFRFALAAGPQAARLGGDVVFATSTPLTIAWPGVVAARRLRVPMVLEVRDPWPEVPIAMGALRSPITILAARWLERFAYRNAAQIVALSPDMKAGIVARGYPPDRVTVLPNACDVELFDVGAAPGRDVRNGHAWLGSRPLVVYTGTLGRLNGVAYLAHLAAAVRALDPEVRFAVIGEGNEQDLVRRTAEELGVLDRTFFLVPPLPKTAVPPWLSAADLATSVVIDKPALWANSANKVFDAFAAGKPVAINHEGWLAALLRETGAGLVLDPRDIKAAAVHLAQALRDRAWLARARAAACRLARERFSRDRGAAELARVLARATGRAPQPAPAARAPLASPRATALPRGPAC